MYRHTNGGGPDAGWGDDWMKHPALETPGKHLEVRLTFTGADLYYGGVKVYTIDKKPAGEYRFGCATWQTRTGFSDLRYITKFSDEAPAQPWNYISFGDGGRSENCTCKKNEICLDPKQQCSWGRFCGDLSDKFTVVDDWQACRASCDSDVNCTAFTYTDRCTGTAKKQCHKSTGSTGCEASKMKMTACTAGNYVSAKKAVSTVSSGSFSGTKKNWKLLRHQSGPVAGPDLSGDANTITKGGSKMMITWSTETAPTNVKDPSTYEKAVEFIVPGIVAASPRGCAAVVRVE